MHVELANHADRVHDEPEHVMVTPRLSVEFPWQEPLVNSALVVPVSWVPVQSAPRHDVAVPAWTVHTRALAAKAKTIWTAVRAMTAFWARLAMTCCKAGRGTISFLAA